jgi:cyclophilin family peptidyl-prolyl cis-trans isomerase
MLVVALTAIACIESLRAFSPSPAPGRGVAGGHNPRYSDALRRPCAREMRQRAPERFAAVFNTNNGPFTASCVRARAPVWVDRVYNLIVNGYYDHNYFFRVLHADAHGGALAIAQFGTAGEPSVSNVYNYTTAPEVPCAILLPQPSDMPCCTAWPGRACSGPEASVGLSNTLGTIAMSTSSERTAEFPGGVTWNATAELFINLGNNSRLDPLLFVPICEIVAGMDAVLAFPSYGEVAELGGPGPSLGLLYEQGNLYIEANASWADMAITERVQIVEGALPDESAPPPQPPVHGHGPPAGMVAKPGARVALSSRARARDQPAAPPRDPQR